MDVFIQILVTGLTLGAMYALASVGLALIWGTLGMFNMAHGLFMTVGAYGSYSAVAHLGLPVYIGLPAGFIAGGLTGCITHLLIVRYMVGTKNFGTNIMVATAGVAILLEDLILKGFGAYPFPQPVSLKGSFKLGNVAISYQALVIVAVAATLIAVTGLLLLKTRLGRAIRATAMNLDAARLMGVQTERTYLQVLAIAGALAGAAGVLISSLATLSPQVGGDPMLKAFVICVVAGLGHVGGTGLAAVALGLIEAAVQYFLGVRFGFPVMLGLVIIFLIWRPNGLFGKKVVVRL
ncbi:MAG: branched-chain amino acid ABC transporter permease [Hyphomicrobiales bacterium]